MAKCYVYAWKNINNGKMNIGYKSPNDKEYTYITSLKNNEFWRDYSYGLLKKSILYVGDAENDNVAKSVEWFALKYAVAVKRDKLYNPGNNANRLDESLIPHETKQLVIDYIEGVAEGMSPLEDDEDVEFAVELNRRIKEGEFEIHQVARSEIEKYARNQVRSKDKLIEHIRKIRTQMIEDPQESRNIYGPIVVVVKASGEKLVIDGNSRLAAAENLVGWEMLPVVYINEAEFGETELQRLNNYDLVGLYENKPSKEIKASNSFADLKRNINNYIVRNNFDLSIPSHVDYARQKIYARFGSVCESKQQLNGILTSIIHDFDKEQAQLKYVKNLIQYDDAWVSRHKWNNYNKHKIACVVVKASEAKYMKALGYIQHAMFNEGSSKGAIVFHFVDKRELVDEEDKETSNIEKLKKVIAFHNLPITVEVLPAFDE